MEQTFETMDKTCRGLLFECNSLSNMLCQMGNIRDGGTMKEIYDRIELIRYKVLTVNVFISIMQAAEDKGVDLGPEINADVSFYFANLITDLRDGAEYIEGYFFANDKCSLLFERWKNLCGDYRKYFYETIPLPKGIDKEMYKGVKYSKKEAGA